MRRWPSCARSSSSRRCTTRLRWRPSTRPAARAAGAAAGRRLRHRVPRHAARRGIHLRRARALAHAVARAPLRLSRPLGAVGERAGARRPARRLPPRRGLLGERRPAGAVRRHDDGLQPARGRAHGHARGLARSGRDPLPAASASGVTGRDRADAGARVGAARALRDSRRASRISSALPHRPRGSRSTSTATASRARSGRWPCALGGLDAIVFSGGVGEGSALVRARVCGRLGFLGVQLDDERNALGDARRRRRAGRFPRADRGPASARRRRRRARRAPPARLVSPPALDDLAVAVVARAEREHLHPVRSRPRTSASRQGRRAPHRACRGRRSRRRA